MYYYFRLNIQNSNMAFSNLTNRNIKMHSKSYQDFGCLERNENISKINFEENLKPKKESNLLKSSSDINLNGIKSRKSSSCFKLSNNTDISLLNGVNLNYDYSAFPKNANIIRLTREGSDFITEFNKKRMERETSL